jgi:hypothetical protein
MFFVLLVTIVGGEKISDFYYSTVEEDPSKKNVFLRLAKKRTKMREQGKLIFEINGKIL